MRCQQLPTQGRMSPPIRLRRRQTIWHPGCAAPNSTPIIRSIASAANSFSVLGQPSGRVIMRLGGANGYQKSPWVYHLETIGHANNEIPGAAFSARSPRGSPNDATILVRRPNLQPHSMAHGLSGYLLSRLRATGRSNNKAICHNRISNKSYSGERRPRLRSYSTLSRKPWGHDLREVS